VWGAEERNKVLLVYTAERSGLLSGLLTLHFATPYFALQQLSLGYVR
jgi:hypothetical protein